MVKGDGRPGRGRCLAEEDDDEYNSRMEFPPDDVIAAFDRQQDKQDKRENEKILSILQYYIAMK